MIHSLENHVQALSGKQPEQMFLIQLCVSAEASEPNSALGSHGTSEIPPSPVALAQREATATAATAALAIPLRYWQYMALTL